MKIFPAIDIKDGKCVRLLKGDFEKSTEYNMTPLEQANEFSKLGYKDLHIVDLDGALKEKPINEKIIEEICQIKKIKVQIGGGIRSIDYIKKLIDIGIDKVILGTIAVEDIKFLENACSKFKNKIAIALDVRNGFIALRGWKKQTEIKASEFVKKVENSGISRIIYTDINRDGTLTKPNLEETFKFSKLTQIPVLVSGGVSSIDDVEDIAKQNKSDSRIEGVVIGKAIYDGRIDHHKLIKMNFFN